jgi:predicted Na+-dependent transporter
MMTDFLPHLLSISTLVFAVSSMLSVGFSYTMQQIIGPLRNARLLIGALLANFVLVPLLAYVITRALSFGEGREEGLFLVAAAAGAPFVIKLVQAAGEDVALASGLLVLLLLSTIVFMPIVVPLALPEAKVSAGSIARPLVVTMLLPLVIGLALDVAIPTWTERLRPVLGTVSTIALVVLFVSTVVNNFGDILSVFGTGAILAALLFILGAFVSGYLLGITGRGTREELGFVTAQRNIAAASIIATQSVEDPNTLVMVVATSVVAMLVLFPTAGLLRRRKQGSAGTDVARQ